jgi:glycosyltransferase involved in cell wall biosynthesis
MTKGFSSMIETQESSATSTDRDQHGQKRLNIGFVTSKDPMDRRSWSGSYYSMSMALQTHCGDVHCLGPVRPAVQTAAKAFNRASRLLLRKGYDYSHSSLVAKRYAQLFKRRLAGRSLDWLFAPAGSTEIAFLDDSVPIVYESDTTFALMRDYYAVYSNLFHFSECEAHSIERLAIRKASLLIYTSEWAAQSAVRDYQADESKIHIIPHGANFEDIPAADAVLRPRESDKCRLLFVGVDWVRKGGEIAVETVSRLRAMGIPAELTICGCVPPAGFCTPELRVIPFLDKNDAAQRKQLAELYLRSHFLLFPTRRDCSPIVFCEANAFGLPAITTNIGGIPDIVTEGKNGFMLPPSSGGSEYAKLISHIWQDPKCYSELASSSRRVFDERLNWDAWAVAVGKLLQRLL